MREKPTRLGGSRLNARFISPGEKFTFLIRRRQQGFQQPGNAKQPLYLSEWESLVFWSDSHTTHMSTGLIGHTTIPINRMSPTD